MQKAACCHATKEVPMDQFLINFTNKQKHNFLQYHRYGIASLTPVYEISICCVLILYTFYMQCFVETSYMMQQFVAICGNLLYYIPVISMEQFAEIYDATAFCR